LKKQSVFKEAKELLKIAISNYEKFCINEVVWDEVLYWLFKKKVDLKTYSKLLHLFELKLVNRNLINLWIDFIELYRLKPHDALILATCKYYGISHIVSLDEDFKKPCKEEGLILINTPHRLKEVLR